MNRFLIGVLNVINQILAVLIILGATVTGATHPVEPYTALDQPWPMLVGGVIGFVSGLVTAALVCGLIAAIVTISRELTWLRLERGRLAYPPPGD
jgi:hypothetical protein